MLGSRRCSWLLRDPDDPLLLEGVEPEKSQQPRSARSTPPSGNGRAAYEERQQRRSEDAKDCNTKTSIHPKIMMINDLVLRKSIRRQNEQDDRINQTEGGSMKTDIAGKCRCSILERGDDGGLT